MLLHSDIPPYPNYMLGSFVIQQNIENLMTYKENVKPIIFDENQLSFGKYRVPGGEVE